MTRQLFSPLARSLPASVPFVGPEALIAQGMRASAVGAVSALASAFPERLAAAVRDPDGEEAAGIGELRAGRASPDGAGSGAPAVRRGAIRAVEVTAGSSSGRNSVNSDPAPPPTPPRSARRAAGPAPC